VEFETPKCWLKSFDSNKVIVEVVKKEGHKSWLELFNPWLHNVTPILRRTIRDIKELDMFYANFNNHGHK
jgi:hypothetical protein